MRGSCGRRLGPRGLVGRCDALQGPPEIGGGGSTNMGCRVSGIGPDPEKDLAQNQRDSRGREVWKTAIFVLGEKSKHKCPRSRDSGVRGRKQKPGGQEQAWEARARRGHAGPLPSRVGAVGRAGQGRKKPRGADGWWRCRRCKQHRLLAVHLLEWKPPPTRLMVSWFCL